MKEVDIKIDKVPTGMKRSYIEVVQSFLKEKNRRYFGIAATSLQNQLDDPKYQEYKPNSKVINIGISGEKQTSKTLRKWIVDKPEVILVDSISLPIGNFEPEEDGEEGQLDLGDTDHLLIIGDSLVIIDSKNWKAKTTYSFGEKPDGKGYEILRGKKSFKGNQPRINQARYLWLQYFIELGIKEVYTFVCISDPEVNIIRDKNWWRAGYKLVNQTTLTYFLDKLYNDKIYQNIPEEERDRFIRVELVAQALTGLTKPYEKYKEKFGTAIYNKVKVK